MSTVLAEPGLLWPQRNNVLLGDGSNTHPSAVSPMSPSGLDTREPEPNCRDQKHRLTEVLVLLPSR